MRASTPTFLGIMSVALLVACSVDTTGLTKESHKTVRGNPQSSVVVTEYGDLQCPACGAAFVTINQPLLKKYGNDIAFQFKQFPLTSVHPYALEAAEASECAADQGKFWEFVDTAYEHQKELSSDALRTWAAQLKLDANLFDRCVRSEIKHDAVKADYDEGLKLGVQGTPTFFVNGVRVTDNALAAIVAAIEAAKKGGGTTMPL